MPQQRNAVLYFTLPLHYWTLLDLALLYQDPTWRSSTLPLHYWYTTRHYYANTAHYSAKLNQNCTLLYATEPILHFTQQHFALPLHDITPLHFTIPILHFTPLHWAIPITRHNTTQLHYATPLRHITVPFSTLLYHYILTLLDTSLCFTPPPPTWLYRTIPSQNNAWPYIHSSLLCITSPYFTSTIRNSPYYTLPWLNITAPYHSMISHYFALHSLLYRHQTDRKSVV